MISAAFKFSGQLSLEALRPPLPAFSSSVGSWSGSGIPNVASEGPIPRMRMRLLLLPSTIKPAMSTLSPDSTRIRVEIFAKCEVGVGVGVAAGVVSGVAVGVAVAAGVAVAVGVAVVVGVAVGVAGGVAIGVAVGVAVAVAVGVG